MVFSTSFKKQFFISFIFVGSFTLIIVLNFLSKQLLFFYVLNGRALDSDILFVLATRYETTKGLLARWIMSGLISPQIGFIPERSIAFQWEKLCTFLLEFQAKFDTLWWQQVVDAQSKGSQHQQQQKGRRPSVTYSSDKSGVEGCCAANFDRKVTHLYEFFNIGSLCCSIC